MESSIPPKADKESALRKKKIESQKENNTELPKSSAPKQVDPREDQSIVLQKVSSDTFSSGESKLDVAMRNQISLSRAITVEIDTLRDLMPKLRKEVQTYSINECQLVKELEKKVPLSLEHKDVRLNLVLEEIQRLRQNRRSTLVKLKESIVKVIELQSRMEVTSYEAGEIFWDRRISKLTNEYEDLDLFARLEERRESKQNFRPAPSPSLSESKSPRPSESKPQDEINVQGNQGHLIEMVKDIKEEYAETKKSSAQIQKSIPQSGIKQESMLNINSPPIRNEPQSTFPVQDLPTSSEQAGNIAAQKTEQVSEPLDFERIVADAQQQAESKKMSTKRGLMIAIIPPAAVLGLLIFDWMTGMVSKGLASLFGS